MDGLDSADANANAGDAYAHVPMGLPKRGDSLAPRRDNPHAAAHLHAHAFAHAGAHADNPPDNHASPATDMDSDARAGAGVDAYAGSADQYASPAN